MSGHSKWHNIQARKGKSDAQRGKIFTKIGREIAVIVKMGGSDPSSNPKLRDVIAKAKQNNMPNDSIERSIKNPAHTSPGMPNIQDVIINKIFIILKELAIATSAISITNGIHQRRWYRFSNIFSL